MANPEHVEILRQGVEIWNRWREDNPDVIPDLRYAKLRGADLVGIDMTDAVLFAADLNSAHLSNSSLIGANLNNVFLNEADLIGTLLNEANLREVSLIRANLTAANLTDANLEISNLSVVNLSGATLTRTDLTGANLVYTDFKYSTCASTNFTRLDLSTTKGLDTIEHIYLSTVGIDTIFLSQGKIPEIFLRGCGVPESLITYLPSMMEDAMQFYSCFISYSHADKDFARLLHDRLQGQGIRCWLDEHQLNPGDKLHSTIDEAIRIYDKVILCCSETALKSWWVEKEFENMIAKEEQLKQTVLIPLTLDNFLFGRSKATWVKNEIKKRKVEDFTNWKDHDSFEESFKSIVKALRTDGGKPPPPEPKLKRRK